MLLLVAAFLPALFLSADAYSCNCPFFNIKWTTAPFVLDTPGVATVKYYFDVTVKDDGSTTSAIHYRINTPQRNFNCDLNFGGGQFESVDYSDCLFTGNNYQSGGCVSGTGDCASFAQCGTIGQYSYVFLFDDDLYFTEDCQCMMVGTTYNNITNPFFLYTRGGTNPNSCDFGDLNVLPTFYFATVFFTISAETFTETTLDSFLDWLAGAIQYERSLIEGSFITNTRRDAQNFTVATIFSAKSANTANNAAQSAYDLDSYGDNGEYDVVGKSIVKNTSTYQDPSPASSLSSMSVWMSLLATVVPLMWWNNHM
jgi:hypothetical protein